MSLNQRLIPPLDLVRPFVNERLRFAVGAIASDYTFSERSTLPSLRHTSPSLLRLSPPYDH